MIEYQGSITYKRTRSRDKAFEMASSIKSAGGKVRIKIVEDGEILN